MIVKRLPSCWEAWMSGSCMIADKLYDSHTLHQCIGAVDAGRHPEVFLQNTDFSQSARLSKP